MSEAERIPTPHPPPRSSSLPLHPLADEREAGFRPVVCERCGATALVAKFSPQHTSVQWNVESVRACSEFSARAAAGEQTALIDTCSSMRRSIDRAVREGRLEILPP